MRDPHSPGSPQFRLRWLASRSSGPAAWLDEEEWIPSGPHTLYDRAKIGLRESLAASGRDGVVLLPAYVPGGVVWAVLQAGLDVRYYPVNADLSLPVEAVTERIERVDPAAVCFVHYFGFVDDAYDELRATARQRDAIVVEDCARGTFGRDRTGRLLGSTGDVALFCLHKTLPVPNGGLTIARHASLPAPERRRAERGRIPRLAALWATRLARIPVDPYPTVERSPGTTDATDAPPPGRKAPGPLTERGLQRVRPAAVQSARREHYRTLRGRLDADPSLEVVTPPVYDGAAPYGVAAVARTAAHRQRLLRALRRAGLPCDVLTWPPVHHQEEPTSYPGAEILRDRLVVFPTHQQLGSRAVAEVADVVSGLHDRE